MKIPGIRHLLFGFLACAVWGPTAFAAAQTEPSVDFTFVPLALNPGSVSNFTPIPGDGDECDWDWGDGDPVKVDQPCIFEAHTYADTGIFTVTLTQPALGSISKDVGVVGRMNGQDDITPKFHASILTPAVGTEVEFTDQTLPADSVGHWTWDFDDGQISYLSHPFHSWDAPGDKAVKLKVQNQFTQGVGRTYTLVIHVNGGPVSSPTVTAPPVQTGTPTRTATPVQGQQILVGYIPVVGSTPGNFGSFFKTSVQLFNPGAAASAGRLVFHPAGVTGVPTNPSLSWSLAPGQIQSYDDVVAAMAQSGLGSIDVYVVQDTPIPVVLTRIFDDAGASGTSGFTEPFYRTSEVPASGSGFLIGPADTGRFRYNIGVRTLDTPVSVTATVRNAAGGVVHTITNAYPKNFFLQTSAAAFLGFSLANNESIQVAFTGGGLIAYGATIDNVTNDPSTQFLDYGAGNQVAESAIPARGRSAAPILFAAILAILGLGVGAVVVKR